MSASASRLTQTVLLLLFCCDVHCEGVITRHFSSDGRKVTFPKVNQTRVCHAEKLGCFLSCAQDARCLHVGVSAKGEVVLFDDPITTSSDKSMTGGFLYSVPGMTTNDARAISKISTTQRTLRITENLSSSNSILNYPASSSSATTTISNSRMTSTGTAARHQDTRMRKGTKQLSVGGLPDTRGGNVVTHPGEPLIHSTYTIVTQTGTKKDSGTACYVYVDIYGQPGMKEELLLDNEGVDDMITGANDTFFFTRSTDLGNITGMILRVEKFGIKPAWFLIGVELRRKRIYEHYAITETFYTYINKWFQQDDAFLSLNKKEETYEMPYKLVLTVTSNQ